MILKLQLLRCSCPKVIISFSRNYNFGFFLANWIWKICIWNKKEAISMYLLVITIRKAYQNLARHFSLGANTNMPISNKYLTCLRQGLSVTKETSDFKDDCFVQYTWRCFWWMGEVGMISICYPGLLAQGLSVHVGNIRVSWKYLTQKLRTKAEAICFSPSNYLASNKDSICSRIQTLLQVNER